MREFGSFRAFAAHLEKLALEGPEVTHHIAEESGKHVQSEAKRKLGTYQEYAGPFVAWAELAESTKADRIAQGYPENEPLLRSGEMRESIDLSVEGHEAIVGSDSEIAMYQELGTSRMPPRPFLGPALYESKPDICEIAGTTVIAWLCGLGWKLPQLRKLP